MGVAINDTKYRFYKKEDVVYVEAELYLLVFDFGLFDRIRERVVGRFKTLSQEEHSERSSNNSLTVLEKYGEQAVIEF